MRIAIALATVILTGGQAGAQPYVGAWTADLAGQTFVRLELQVTNGALAGRISLGDIHVGAQGDVTQVLAVARDFTPVENVVLRADAMSFTRKDDDDADQFELRVAPDGTLRLTFLPTEEIRAELARDGIPVPNPIVLKKVVQ